MCCVYVLQVASEFACACCLSLTQLDTLHQSSRHCDQSHAPRSTSTCRRATVRELSSTSDAAAQYGKLAAELDHVRAKEGLARSALNRSEMERVELERQGRALKQQVASLNVRLSLAQDQARCVSAELLMRWPVAWPEKHWCSCSCWCHSVTVAVSKLV